jgi:hypothetical protein
MTISARLLRRRSVCVVRKYQSGTGIYCDRPSVFARRFGATPIHGPAVAENDASIHRTDDNLADQRAKGDHHADEGPDRRRGENAGTGRRGRGGSTRRAAQPGLCLARSRRQAEQ